jgi:hypothetical protein
MIVSHAATMSGVDCGVRCHGRCRRGRVQRNASRCGHSAKVAELNVIGVMARAMLHPALHMALVSGTTRMGANHQMRSEAGLLVRVGQGGFRSADGLRRERHHPRHFLGTLALQKRPEAFVHAPVHIDGISADRDAADRSI